MQGDVMLDHALGYVKQGYSIFPVAWWPTGKEKKPKRPLVAWEQFQTQKPTEADIRYWWKQWPHAAIGLVTGEINGIIVVDAERDANFSLFGCDKIETPTSATGGGGRHYFFAYEPTRNATKFAPFYDIRGDGGYVIAPPSKHESGGVYEWLTPFGTSPLAPFPNNVREALKQIGESQRKSVTSILSEITQEGSRNDTAASVVGKLLSRFKPSEWESMAWPLLQGWNEAKTSSPLDNDELRAVYESIGKSELQTRLKTAKGFKNLKESATPQVFDDGEDIRVVLSLDDGDVEFLLEDAEQLHSDELNGVLSTKLLVPGITTEVFTSRINIESGSARDSYCRQLGRSYGKDFPWDLLLSRANARFKVAIRNRIRSLWIEEAAPNGEDRWLFDPFILDGGANILFGKGGGGKTFLTLRIALSLATGLPLAGFTPARKVKTLFVDYEDAPGNLQDRIYKLCGSTLESFKPDLNDVLGKIRYFSPKGVPLSDLVSVIRDEITKYGIGLVIVDSAALACGGEPEKAEPALRYFNALSKLGVSTLTIAHETKNENHEYVFGSVFFHNSARNIWNTQSETDTDDPRIVQMGLFHRKSNHGPMHRPVALRFFHGDKFTDVGNGTISTFFKELSAPQKILQELQAGKASVPMLVAATGEDAQRVKNDLSRLKKKGKIVSSDDGFWELFRAS